jgi:uncharacterized protein (DUF58 family)
MEGSMMSTPATSTPVPDGSVIELEVTETLRGHVVAAQWFCQDCARDVIRDANANVAEGTWKIHLTQGGVTHYNTGRHRRVSHRWIEVDARTAMCLGDADRCPIAATHATVY